MSSDAGAAAAGPSDEWPLVVAIVVNFRNADLTVACVESLARARGARVETVIVDNASGDDSLAVLAARLPQTPVVARSSNGGYTAGANAGFRYAFERGARYAFLLNNDTTVEPDCVATLVAEAERDDRVALLNPRIFSSSAAGLVWFGGSRFTLWTGRPRHLGWKEPRARWIEEPVDIPYATGAAMLVRLSALEQVGLFDESFFTYAEDVDLSLRFRAAGYRIRYVPGAEMWHLEGVGHRKAGGGGDSLRYYLLFRNLLRVLGRHARWYHWPTLVPAFAVDMGARHAWVAVRNRDWRALGAIGRGMLHAITGGRHPIETAGSRRGSPASRP